MGQQRFQDQGLEGRWLRPEDSLCCFVLLAALALLSGCGSSQPVVFEEDTSRQNLQRIGVAYAQVSATLGRPPQDIQELRAAVQEGPDQPPAADILRSPNDGEDYVVVLNVDFRQLAAARGNVDVVLAYEKHGKGGRRYVLKPPSHVLVMSDEEFKAASFPPGHQPVP